MRISFLILLQFVIFFSYGQEINQLSFDSLILKARNSHSDGLVILQDGKMKVEEYFNQPKEPIYIASVGKALMGIAILKLLNDGKIKSVDQPVADFYPEWRQGQKKDITLRMILNHTSGLQNERNTRLEIETGPEGKGNDLVKLALASEVVEKPGTVYRYNNKAICLLPGIIEKASGISTTKYFENEFFKPMGITNYKWNLDNAGTPHGHAAFRLLPVDLAKFGQLMLGNGELDGKQFFQKRWVDSALLSSHFANPQIGLIWNLFRSDLNSLYIDSIFITKLEAKGVSDSVLSILKSLLNNNYSEESLAMQLETRLGSKWLSIIKEATKDLPNGFRDLFKMRDTFVLKGYYHTGSWGNYLVVYPALKLVAVRVVKRDKNYVENRDLFGSFVREVFNITPKKN